MTADAARDRTDPHPGDTGDLQLREVVAFWPQVHPVRSIAGVAAGYSGARVFRVESEAGMFCLRQWPPGGLPELRIRELHRLLDFLGGAGISQIAVPLPSRIGLTVVDVGGRLWHLEPWMPGTADFHRHPTDARLRRAAAALAQLHLAAARYQAGSGSKWFSSGRGPAPAVRERIERLRQLEKHGGEFDRSMGAGSGPESAELLRSMADAIRRAAPVVRGELAAEAETVVGLHPCLRDIWHDHVLFLGDEVAGIIDASAARTENVASDISRMLGSLVGDDFARWDQALQAYSEIRPLTAAERRLVAVLDRSGVVLSAAHWVERAKGREVTGRERDRIQVLAARLENLARSAARLSR